MQEMLTCLGTKVLVASDFKDLSYHVGALGRNTLWVCDTNTSKMVRPLPVPNVVMESGEGSKNYASVERIISTAVENSLGRDCTFIALGGGVVSDITAFAASIYMRGCRVVLIPTTLIAMTDASIGGKTCVDFRYTKNLIGTFFPANEVLICADCLKSLPNRDLSNGLAEVIKHSLLAKDDGLFNLLATSKQRILEKDTQTLGDLVRMSLEVKRSFVEPDPYDRLGIRAALNLGHTFAHALESLSRLQWTHGQAVAWGICRAMQASLELGLCQAQFAQGVEKLIQFYGYDTKYRISRSDWMDYRRHLQRDKKAVMNVVKFVLLTSQGEIKQTELGDDLIKKLVMMPSF